MNIIISVRSFTRSSRSISKRFCLCTTLLCLVQTFLHAQQEVEVYRPKVAEFSAESIWNYNSHYDTERAGEVRDEVESDILLKFKMAAPLIMKEGKLLAAQFKYYEHRFDFNFNNAGAYRELFSHLDRL